MIYTATKTLLILTAILAFTGINAFAQRDNLSTEQWKLTQAYGKRLTDSSAFFEINIGRTRFMGNTGCNQMFGSVTVKGRQIDFADIGSTKMACQPRPGGVAEATFLKGLNDTVRYRQNGNQMNFFDRRGRTILRFRILVKQPPVDNNAGRLEDKKWMLDAIGNRKVTVSDAFVAFDRTRESAGGNSGCNVFGGSYTSANKTLTITEIISTMRACEEVDKMQIEREFLDGLRKANRYEISDGRLILYRGTHLLLSFRGEQK